MVLMEWEFQLGNYHFIRPVLESIRLVACLLCWMLARTMKIFKKIRRQGYRRTRGHRQMESVLRITGIEGAGEKAKWDGETSLMTKAEMNLRARGLASRDAEVDHHEPLVLLTWVHEVEV